MSKFKTGDKVRWVGSERAGRCYGDVEVVTRLRKEFVNGMYEGDWKLIEEDKQMEDVKDNGVIETKTKAATTKRVKQGVYTTKYNKAKVAVDWVGVVSVAIGIVRGTFVSARDLRELADLFNEMADILEAGNV